MENSNKNLFQQVLFPKVEMPQIKAPVLGEIYNWPVSNSTTFLWFITILFLLFVYAAKKFTLVPGFFQNLVEMLFEAIENLLNSLTNGRAHRANELLYPIAGIFFMVGTINILGSFPIITEFTWNTAGTILPLFKKSTADINVTLPLAVVIVLSVQYFGISNWGFFGYFKRFLPLDVLWKETIAHGISGFFMGLIELFVGLLEFVSECVKIISLSLRLFGNMFAGEILFAILTGIFSIALPAVWLGFDFMVAIIQTLVLGCLASVYYVMVVKEHDQKSH